MSLPHLSDSISFHIMDECEIKAFRLLKQNYLKKTIYPFLEKAKTLSPKTQQQIRKQLMRLRVICETYHIDPTSCFQNASFYFNSPTRLEHYITDIFKEAHHHKEKLDYTISEGKKLRKKNTLLWPQIFNNIRSNDIYIRLDSSLPTLSERFQQHIDELNADTPIAERLELKQNKNSWIILTNEGKLSQRAIAFLEKRAQWVQRFKTAFRSLPHGTQEDFSLTLLSLNQHKELSYSSVSTPLMKQIKESFQMNDWPLSMPSDVFYYLKHYLARSHFHRTDLSDRILMESALTRLNELYLNLLTDISHATHQLSHKSIKNHLSDESNSAIDTLIISKSPTRLARMSTYTDWDLASCRFAGHDFHHEIIDDIGNGTLIVLGYSSENPFRALCRSLIKPFRNEQGQPYYDLETPYGLIVGKFEATVRQIIRNTFYEKETTLNGHYSICDNLVSENNVSSFDVAGTPIEYAQNTQKRTYPNLKNGQPDGKTILVGSFSFFDFYRAQKTELTLPDWSNTIIKGVFFASNTADFTKMPYACDKLELRRFNGKSLKEIPTHFKTLSLISPTIQKFHLTDLPKSCHSLELRILKKPLSHMEAPKLESLIWDQTDIQPNDILNFSRVSYGVFNNMSINNNNSIQWPKTLRIYESHIEKADFSKINDLSISYTTLNGSFIHFPNNGTILMDKVYFEKNQTVNLATCKKADLINCNLTHAQNLTAPSSGEITCYNCSLPKNIDLSQIRFLEFKHCFYANTCHILLPDQTTLELIQEKNTNQQETCIESSHDGKVTFSGFIFGKGSVLKGSLEKIIFKECDTTNLVLNPENNIQCNTSPEYIRIKLTNNR